MILLKQVRLINWYGFVNVTAPVGFFTLIAGKNGNGKSVLLDAVKYAAYGDTVFNKSSESKGSRTLSSYTRGLLDATAGTCMRPADKVPNVYSHIALEYYDEAEEKSFVLGVIIETAASNNYQTYRYVLDRRTLSEIEHTYRENGTLCPYGAAAFQRRYQTVLLNREQGLARFLQMTGLKLNLKQLPTYLRKLRGIMSYDPDAKIDRFIRESVLEERNVDFAKLIEAKENIERLNGTFHLIENEIEELDKVLGEYDTWESERNRLLSDDIKLSYRRLKALEDEIAAQTRKRALAEQKKEELLRLRAQLEEQLKDLEDRLMQARIGLNQLDSTQAINEEERHLTQLAAEKREWLEKCQDLETFQARVGEILHGFFLEGRQVEKKEVLASLCGAQHTALEKENAAESLLAQVRAAYEEQVEKEIRLRQGLEELEKKLAGQEQILEECEKHKNTYGQIPEYTGLREEINREFARRGIRCEARFACEYVSGLRDESWRDAIEAFLGPKRYTILVEPAYYDIADDVLNRSQYRHAHIFNTRLLMQKSLTPEEDSALHLLEMKNPVAQQYFAWQLGRMHAVELDEVRRHENAISREGRVAVAMDGYFLRFERIRSYYLGQEAVELNRARAKREKERLIEEKKGLLAARQEAKERKDRLNEDQKYFKAYAYDAHQAYQKTAMRFEASQKQLQKLRKAQQDNREFMELSRLEKRLSDELAAMRSEQKENFHEETELAKEILRCSGILEREQGEQEAEQKRFLDYETESYTVAKKAVEAYERYLESGMKGAGGLLAQETRGRVKRSIEQHQNTLHVLQVRYNSQHPEALLPEGTDGREIYARRREQIWMDNLQEIRNKLEEQTRRYEDIFKNEFVLTILKSCERAREDLRQINLELAKLQFASRYQFDVHSVKDGSEYAKILEYARYLDEREQLGGGGGQMTFGALTKISDEEGEGLEKELKQIINRIMQQNSEEAIARFADYRNYMTYEILVSNQILDRARLSRQTGYNSGAEVQIPYLLILSAALLMIYNQRVNSTRLVFIDEPFAKMDPGNVKVMLDFMRAQGLQVLFCSPDKTESIGGECEVILPVLRVRADRMEMGIVQFHEEKGHGGR